MPQIDDVPVSAALTPPAQEDEPEEWISLEPRTPFQAYPQRRKRY
jgi:hypothetical protein